MSSYLNFYLVPKKEKADCRPLHFLSYCRNTEVYQLFWENINPVFIGNDEEYHYSELTDSDIDLVLSQIREDIKKAEQSLKYESEVFHSISNPNKEVIDDYTETYCSRMDYINDLKNARSEIIGIKSWFDDIKYSDFEKVLINID